MPNSALEYVRMRRTARPKTIAYANGVTTSFTYSTTRRWLTRIVTTAPGSVVLMDTTYTRDFAGRITGINGLAAAEDWNYSYNHLDWLLTADNLGDNTLDETFAYSPSGNHSFPHQAHRNLHLPRRHRGASACADATRRRRYLPTTPTAT